MPVENKPVMLLTVAEMYSNMVPWLVEFPQFGTRRTKIARPVVFYFQSPKTNVYLLYLDESGNESDPSDKFFVLGGAAVFERVTYFF